VEEETPYKLGGLLVRECDTPAKSLLLQADAYREKGEFRNALAVYQKILRTYPSALYPLTPESFTGRPGVTYVSAQDYVEEQMGSLPQEAREIYASLYEARAKSLLTTGAETRDPEPLLMAARLFPIAPSGIGALGLLARWDLQNGRWASASSRFRAVLRRDRFRWDRRVPEIRSLGLALSREGRAGELGKLASDVKRRFEGERGAELGAHLMELTRRMPSRKDQAFWSPRFGVDNAGRGVTTPAVGDVPLNWAASLPKPPGRMDPYRNRFRNRNGYEVDTPLENLWRPFYPAVYGDRVYLHNGIHFLCFDLLRGQDPVWKTDSPYAGAMVVGLWNFEPNRIFTITIAENVVYALMEVPAAAEGLDSRMYSNFQVIPPLPRRRLVALDIHTGRILWESGAKERPLSFLDRLSFCSEPLVRNDRLYLAGAIFEGIPTAFVVCLDATDGSLIWRRRICAGSQELNMFGRPVREYCGSSISATGDALYFCTNLGAIASIRASDGEWRWLFRYPPVPKVKSQSFETIKIPPAWSMNPVIATPDRIVAAPTDSDLLFALDPDSGACRWVMDGKMRWSPKQHRMQLCGPFYLLGLWGENVVAHGEQVRAYNIRSGKLIWRSRFHSEEENPTGRGAIAGDWVYVPTDKALYVFEAKGGRCVRRTPWTHPAAEGGNVTVAGGYLLTTTRGRLNCFVDRGRLEERIKRDALERPRDPLAALRAARVCLRNRNMREALQFFRNAENLSGPADPLRDQARLGIFQTLGKMGESAWRRGLKGEAVSLYRQSLPYAPNDEKKVFTLLQILDYHRREGKNEEVVNSYNELIRDYPRVEYAFEGDPVRVEIWARFGLARHYASSGRPSQGVVEYQIIIDRFRDLSFRLGTEKGPAGKLAKQAVDALMERHGRGVYAPFEKKAKDLFNEGMRKKDAHTLHDILRLYPNAKVIEKALIALGRMHFDREEVEQADEVLKRFLREFTRSESIPQVLALLALTLEKQDRYLEARRVLVRLMKRFPKTRLDTLPQGAQEAGPWATGKLNAKVYQRVKGSEGRSDLAWKGGKKLWTVECPNKPVLFPVDGVRPIEVTPLVLARVGREFRVVSTLGGETLWSTKAIRDPKNAAFAGRTLVIQEPYALWGFSLESGEKRWTRTFSNHGVIKGMAVKGDIIAVTVLGLDGKANTLWLALLDGDSGEYILPPKNLEQWGGVSIPAIGVEVVAAYIREGAPRIFAFDLVDGRELMAHTVKGWLQCPPVLFESQRRLVYCTMEAATGLDLSGRVVWSFQVRGIDRSTLLRLGEVVAFSRLAEDGVYELVALNVKDGRILWQEETKMQNIKHKVAVGKAFYLLGMRGNEQRVMRFERDTGKLGMVALVNNRPGSFPPSVYLGQKVGVAKTVWRQTQRMDGAFRIFSMENGKILQLVNYPKGNLSDHFFVVDGRLVYTKGSSILAWGK
jgi:outer membrane protein assembly factor BamB